MKVRLYALDFVMSPGTSELIHVLERMLAASNTKAKIKLWNGEAWSRYTVPGKKGGLDLEPCPPIACATFNIEPKQRQNAPRRRIAGEFLASPLAEDFPNIQHLNFNDLRGDASGSVLSNSQYVQGYAIASFPNYLSMEIEFESGADDAAETFVASQVLALCDKLIPSRNCWIYGYTPRIHEFHSPSDLRRRIPRYPSAYLQLDQKLIELPSFLVIPTSVIQGSLKGFRSLCESVSCEEYRIISGDSFQAIWLSPRLLSNHDFRAETIPFRIAPNADRHFRDPFEGEGVFRQRDGSILAYTFTKHRELSAKGLLPRLPDTWADFCIPLPEDALEDERGERLCLVRSANVRMTQDFRASLERIDGSASMSSQYELASRNWSEVHEMVKIARTLGYFRS